MALPKFKSVNVGIVMALLTLGFIALGVFGGKKIKSEQNEKSSASMKRCDAGENYNVISLFDPGNKTGISLAKVMRMNDKEIRYAVVKLGAHFKVGDQVQVKWDDHEDSQGRWKTLCTVVSKN